MHIDVAARIERAVVVSLFIYIHLYRSTVRNLFLFVLLAKRACSPLD